MITSNFFFVTLYIHILLYIGDFMFVEHIPIHNECIQLEKRSGLGSSGDSSQPTSTGSSHSRIGTIRKPPLSTLSVEDSGPPQVTYDSQQPIATSTPRATSTLISDTPSETYHQIIPGMSDRLYPTLLADGSLGTQVVDNHGTLQNQITSEVDKYLQEAAERHERDINYFDGWHVATNTSSQQQKLNFVEHDEEKVPESNGNDTSENGAQNAEHNIQYHDDFETIPEEDEDPQMAAKQDVDNFDTIAYNQEELEEEPFNMAINDTSKDPTIVMGKPVTAAFVSDDVHIPTEKVGCLQVTSQLQEFLNHFPPESKEKAFEQIY